MVCCMQVKAEIRQRLLGSIGDSERRLRATIVSCAGCCVSMVTGDL